MRAHSIKYSERNLAHATWLTIDLARASRSVRRARFSSCYQGEGPRVETLEQRYNRLRQEFEEFQVQVEAAKTAAAPEGGDAATAVAIAEQVKFMQDQLQQVNLDQVLGGDSVTSDDVPGMQAELTK